MIRELLRAQIEDVWGQGRLDLVDRHYAADCVDHMPIAGQGTGLEAMKDVVRAFRAAMPDLAMRLTGTLAAGDIGVDFWTLTGTHSGPLFGIAPTGRRVEIAGIDMVRVAENRIAELWHVEEMLQFWHALGLVDAAFGQAQQAGFMPIATAGEHDPGEHARVAIRSDHSDRDCRNLWIARRHIEEMWARGQGALGHELYAPGVVDHNPAPGQRPGIDGIIDVIRWLTEAVPDLTMNVHQYVVDGAFVADRWTMRGHHTGAPLMGIAALGRAFEINGMDVVRIGDDGRITDVWHVEEFDRLRAAIA